MPTFGIRGVHCCGNVCFDMPVWPVEQMGWGATTWVEQIEESLGGNGGNTSYALARLGVPVRLTGVVGEDVRGDKVLRALHDAGVNADGVRRTNEQPTTATVVVVHPTADRLFLHLPGASKSLDVEEVVFEPPGVYSHFHFANPFSLPKLRKRGAELLTRARNAGLTTSLDTGYDSRGTWMEDLAPCLHLVDLLFVNENELLQLSGHSDVERGIAALRGAGASSVVVKLGSRGCAFTEAGEIGLSPAFEVQAKDTTGAGDSFVGGFLAALHNGLSFTDAARTANAVGACKVQKLGAAQGVLTWDETVRWMAEQG